MMWIFRRREMLSMGEKARRLHSAWLTHALETRREYPRIPVRRVDHGGFDRLIRRERGRLAAERWWSGALDRVEVGLEDGR